MIAREDLEMNLRVRLEMATEDLEQAENKEDLSRAYGKVMMIYSMQQDFDFIGYNSWCRKTEELARKYFELEKEIKKDESI